jgi:protein tyrosine phosphatase (PTP) superfamily phosphohydrolase (DUF442 family)
MKNEAVIGGITVGGQPSAEELRSGRFTSVINIRHDDEIGNISAGALAGSGVAYASVPYTSDTVTEDDIDRIRDLVDQSGGSGVLIH